MALQIWLPLNGSLENKGLSDLNFNPVDSNTVSAAAGKIGEKCYYNNSHNAGGFISNKKIYLGNNLSIFCWMKFSTLM